jgi:hypothetical protein
VPAGTEPRSIGEQELAVAVWGIGEGNYRIDLASSDANLIAATKRRIGVNGFFDVGAGRHIAPNEIGQATTIATYCSPFGCYLLVPFRFLLEGTLTAKFDVLMLNGECKPFPALIAGSGEETPLVTTRQL